MQQLTQEQIKDLAFVEGQIASLGNKAGKWTKQDEVRFGLLKAQAASIHRGATLRELQQENLNDVEKRDGLRVTTFTKDSMTVEQRANATAFRAFARGEHRDNEGAPMISHIGSYSGLGYFAPNSFFESCFQAAKAYDFLFDPENVTFISTANGRIMTVPTMSDVEHDASPILESGSRTEVDIASLNQATLPVYSMASRRWQVSLEAFSDLPSTLSAMSLFQSFTTKSLARGIGRMITTGNGVNQSLGLVPALEAAGVVPISAAGSSVNDGTTATGANSIGSQDLANMVAALDPAYLNSPKTCFAMNNGTLNSLRGLVNKFGSPLNIVVDTPSGPTIYGLPVRIAPSLDSIGASNVPVVLGNFEYAGVRIATGDDNWGIKAFTEAPGIAENGLVAFRSFCRAGFALLWSDTSSPCPFVLLKQHS